MSEQSTESKQRPNWLNLTTFILMALGFLGGFTTNYITRSAQLDQVIEKIGALQLDFKNFSHEYNLSHEDTAISIKSLNQHLEYTDRRIDELEQKARLAR